MKNNVLANELRNICIVGSMLFLSGCLSNRNVEGAYPPAPPGYAQGAAIGAVTGTAIAGFNNGSHPLGLAVGALLGAPVGSYNDSEGAIKALAAEGITVIRLGDIVEVVIPHDLVFDPENNELTLDADDLLNQVVAILRQYPDVDISVVGHSDDLDTEDAQQNRSVLQAEAIMSYVWSHGIPIERLYYYGVGATETDASLKYPNGQSYNRRVVINFWRKGVPGPVNGIFTHDNNGWLKLNLND
ncbi:MAG: OmpA family protein [Gammaproteobacteria bacterium]|nr:OmpA family protein [Gammaproteobacteria bacterium]